MDHGSMNFCASFMILPRHPPALPAAIETTWWDSGSFETFAGGKNWESTNWLNTIHITIIYKDKHTIHITMFVYIYVYTWITKIEGVWCLLLTPNKLLQNWIVIVQSSPTLEGHYQPMVKWTTSVKFRGVNRGELRFQQVKSCCFFAIIDSCSGMSVSEQSDVPGIHGWSFQQFLMYQDQFDPLCFGVQFAMSQNHLPRSDHRPAW
jgi:hypothetical protein